MPLLNPLDSQCQAFINANQEKATQLIVRLTKKPLHNATEKVLSNYLLDYRASPWYQRWWLRLIRPINRLETLYHAKRLSRINNHEDSSELLKALKEAKSQLHWYSSLYFSISRALRLLVRKKDLSMPKQENSNKPQKAVDNTMNASQDMSLVPSSSVANEKPSPQLTLDSPELIAACQALGIEADRPIHWAQIRNAYLKLSLRYHPDKNQGNEGYTQPLFQHIQDAYDALEEYYNQLNDINSPAPQEATWGDILVRLQRVQQAMDELERNEKQRLKELKRNDEIALKAQQEAIEARFSQENSELRTQIQTQAQQMQTQAQQQEAIAIQLGQENSKLKTQMQTQALQMEAILTRLSLMEQKQSSPPPSDGAADQPSTAPDFFKRGIG